MPHSLKTCKDSLGISNFFGFRLSLQESSICPPLSRKTIMVDSEPVCLPVPQQKKPKLLKCKSDMLKLAATATHNEENSEHIHCSLYFCSSVTSMIKVWRFFWQDCGTCTNCLMKQPRKIIKSCLHCACIFSSKSETALKKAN